ncbi:MAG: M20/M25/M40 family metallo-hydrolase, partial [Oscillospiraceae bacterium]|nr:M20/M25/M40 family metallo-hydrolase [Oscillospiraceae bacterium]
MSFDRLSSIIDSLNDKYISFWGKVSNIESPTSYKAGIDAVGEQFINLANELGFPVEVMEHEVAGNAICITINPASGERPVVFSGHIDTVYPIGLFGNPAVHYEDDRICGPGVRDCKGGVVAGFLAMDALKECGFTDRPVVMYLQSDEEGGG